MPNYVINKLHLSGEQSRIDELLKSVKGEESTIDFNKIIPMPESLNIESGSRTYNGLKAYKDFIDVYTMMGTEKQNGFRCGVHCAGADNLLCNHAAF